MRRGSPGKFLIPKKDTSEEIMSLCFSLLSVERMPRTAADILLLG